ncbi:hypothetical protein [Streptomyces zhihengii]|uniref:hypothetical protein n=1 Tax=Streptomyces zhihengii TaxID=1818004 RepID=UPI0033B52DA3
MSPRAREATTAFLIEFGDWAEQKARAEAHARLTAMRWPGPVEHATAVVGILADNANRHGRGGQRRFGVGLHVGAGELTVDVTDGKSAFDAFDQVIGHFGGSLWRARIMHGARLTWHLNHENPGKTVRAMLQPGPVAL